MKYILQGPTTIGNSFGFWGVYVPSDRWVIVEDGDLTNGGFGPYTVNGTVYRSAERAREVLAQLQNPLV